MAVTPSFEVERRPGKYLLEGMSGSEMDIFMDPVRPGFEA